MAFNLTRGDTRPILIGLAIAALLGWGLFIYAELHGAAQNQKARQQISQLSTSEESLGLSQSFGVYPALSLRAAYAPPTSEVAHAPERPCREAEASG